MLPSPIRATPANRMPSIISRRGPNRSTIHQATNPSKGPTTNLLSAFPEVTWARVHPNCWTMKS
jgi:hypothetical protein